MSAVKPPDAGAPGKVFDLSRYLGGVVSAGEPVPLYTLEQLREKAAAVSWLVKGAMQADAVGVFFGGGGTFKSFIALDLALHVAHGLPWLGRRTKQGAVVYIAAEGGSGLWRRVDAWHRARRLKWTDLPFFAVPTALDLGSDCLRLQEAITGIGVAPALIVVDTMSQTFSGEENSATEVRAYLRELSLLLRAIWQCTVAVIHHSGHQATERPRGSSVIHRNTDFMFGVFRDEKEMLATMTNDKQKEGESISEESFSLSSIELGTDEDGDPITSLVARHLSSVEELQLAADTERRAGRGGKNQAFLSLIQNGERESSLRKAFYDECAGMEDEARRKAYFRARNWAIKAGYIDIAQGTVVSLKGRDTK